MDNDYGTLMGSAGEAVSDKSQEADSGEVATVMSQGSKDKLTENQQLAESGEFDQLLGSVNSNLSELGLEEDSREMVGALTEIANAGNPEYRVWAGKMLNWHNDMANFMKGL